MEKLHIAVCDDDVTAREVISGSLKGVFAQHGVDAVLESYGSADALGADLCSKAFDLLLLDIDMPGTDGITFATICARNRTTSRSSTSPIGKTACSTRCAPCPAALSARAAFCRTPPRS